MYYHSPQYILPKSNCCRVRSPILTQVISFGTVFVFSDCLLLWSHTFRVHICNLSLKITTIIALGGYFKLPAPAHFIFVFMISYKFLKNLWQFDGVLYNSFISTLTRGKSHDSDCWMSFCFKYLIQTWGRGCFYVLSFQLILPQCESCMAWNACHAKLNKNSIGGWAKPQSPR